MKKFIIFLGLAGAAAVLQPEAKAQTTTGGTGIGTIGQTTTGIGQTTIGIGQNTIGIGQTPVGIGQPTIGIGQPTTGVGQTTIGIGQNPFGIGPMANFAATSNVTGFAVASTNAGSAAAVTNITVAGGFNGQFLRRAIADSQLEIMLGQLAQTNAQNSAVQNFGGALVTDHTAMLAQAETLAASLGINAPDVTRNQQQFVNSFGRLGSQFDIRFVNFSIQSHIRDINLFENAALRSRNADVRAFARAQLPVLTQHLVSALELRETLLGL